jgi:hypothetical protein
LARSRHRRATPFKLGKISSRGHAANAAAVDVENAKRPVVWPRLFLANGLVIPLIIVAS